MSEETIVGVHESGIELQEGMNTSYSRNYCSNCKKKIHCFVKVDRDTKEAIIVKNCKSDDCECKCRTHYACKLCGYLHPYGYVCKNKSDPIVPYNPKTDKLIAEINKQYNESKKETKVEPKT